MIEGPVHLELIKKADVAVKEHFVFGLIAQNQIAILCNRHCNRMRITDCYVSFYQAPIVAVAQR